MTRLIHSKLFPPINAYLAEQQCAGVINAYHIHDNVRSDGVAVSEHCTGVITGTYAALQDTILPELHLIIKKSALSTFQLSVRHFRKCTAWMWEGNANPWGWMAIEPKSLNRSTEIMWADKKDMVICQFSAGDVPELSNKLMATQVQKIP